MRQANPSCGALQCEGVPWTAASFFVCRVWLLYRLSTVADNYHIFSTLFLHFFTFILYYLRMFVQLTVARKNKCEKIQAVDPVNFSVLSMNLSSTKYWRALSSDCRNSPSNITLAHCSVCSIALGKFFSVQIGINFSGGSFRFKKKMGKQLF